MDIIHQHIPNIESIPNAMKCYEPTHTDRYIHTHIYIYTHMDNVFSFMALPHEFGPNLKYPEEKCCSVPGVTKALPNY